MLNALSVDLEDWYHVCGVDKYSQPSKWASYESRIIRNSDKVLRLLKEFDTKATFFVLGYIARKEPNLIKEISTEGHEIASHGYCHFRIFELDRESFRDDLRKSVDSISGITGKKVLGFRAPEWSIRSNTLWVLDIMRESGILYDSSIVPLTGMGIRGFKKFPHKIPTPFGEIYEFPLTTTRLFWENLPFTGGLPLRIAPLFYVVSKMKRINREGYPCISYMHPWEFDMEQPELDIPLSRRFMHYFNLKASPQKIRSLLENFKFGPIKDVLDLEQ